MDDRTCLRCGETKPVSAYQGNRQVCRTCRNKQQVERRWRRKERQLETVEPTPVTVNQGDKTEFTVTGNDAVFVAQSQSPIKTVNQLLAAYSIDLTQWQILDTQIKTVSTDDRLVYNVRVNLKALELKPVRFAPIHPVRVDTSPKFTGTPTHPKSIDRQYVLASADNGLNRQTVNSTRIAITNNNSLKTCLVVPDSQNGFYRKPDGSLDPMHDPQCWDLVHQLNRHIKPNTIVLLGDMIDLAEWSDKYTSSPDMAYTTQATIDDLARTLGQLRRDNPTAQIVYIEGNHEKRFQLAILNHLKAAYGLRKAGDVGSHDTFSLPYLLGLEELGIEYRGSYPDGSFYLNDSLEFGHGTIVRGGGGETAKAVLKDMDHSYCYGHIHRHELRAHTIHKRDGSQEVRYAFSPGTIARIDGAVPANSKRNDWQQGLSVVTYSDKQFAIEMLAIDTGELFYRGQLFRGV